MAFKAYANNDLIEVDETDNVNDLKKKLKSDDRQVIVTTIQKLQRLIKKRLVEGTPEYQKIKSLKIAFVVDECHRAVAPNTKRELEKFFGNSLWFGFTGTPRFAENPYPLMGDLPRTTEELYGEVLHKYTIQNAIHDKAVLGFQVEHNGPKNIADETDGSVYDNEVHMLKVLEVILNKSYHKLGFQNGKGKTYEALLTTSSIQMAQKYYELLTKVKKGETSLVISEKIKQVLPDFPKFAITYSVSENEEGSQVNQQKMQSSIKDYNEMFGTKFEISQIQGYNSNLNKRLARKEPKFQSRNEQLDLVIVVDRLLTGFDAPCLSAIFIDRQPMGPHDLIQAFSRTNRILNKNKTYGQIVTFQAPVLFKECVDNAIKLYSAGGTKEALMADWEEIEQAFIKALAALRICAKTPEEIPGMSLEEKKVFAKVFQNFDKLFAQLKSFTNYEDSMLEEYGITEEEYYDYAGHYLNILEEIEPGTEPGPDTASEHEPDTEIDPDYELMAYSNTKIDYAEEHERQTTLDFHHQLKGAILDAVDEGLLERDPTRKAIIKGKTPKSKKIKYLNQFELHLLLAHLDIKEEPNWDWFILLVAKTGMRFSEALAITPGDFDFARQTLSISKTWDYKGEGGFLPTKNKSSVRKIQIDWQIVVKFSELIKGMPEDEPIFVGEDKIYNSTVNDVLTRHCKACGISVISIHGLRHTHASLLLFAGVSIASVARRLGHASMTTTQKTYLHIIQELENKDVDLVMRTLSGL